MWKNCPHWLHIKPKILTAQSSIFFCLFSPSNQKTLPPLTLGFLLSVVISGSHEVLHNLPFPCTFPWFFQSPLFIWLHFTPAWYTNMECSPHCISILHKLIPWIFFSLPAMHSRRVLWLKKTILLEVLQAQVLKDKKPPQLIVLSNCNGAAMAKNNTNQETSIGGSILLWDTRTHPILTETTAPASMPVWKWILFSVICYCECPGHLWSIPGTEDQTAAAVSSPQLLSKMKHHFKRNSVFSCWMTVSPTPFRKLAWGILTFEDICLVIGSLVSVWGQLILVTDRIKENLPS